MVPTAINVVAGLLSAILHHLPGKMQPQEVGLAKELELSSADIELGFRNLV